VSAPELTAAVAAINGITIPSNIHSLWSPGTTLSGVTLEARTHAGVLEAQASGLRSTPVAGTGTATLPFQSALVLSMRTTAGGQRGRGRLYMPATGTQLVAATNRVTSSQLDGFLTSMKTYLAAVQTAIDTNVDETVGLAIWSRTALSSALVTQLRVGDVVDTQRRRRDAVPETYREVVYP
jgi:hypothetical protein